MSQEYNAKIKKSNQHSCPSCGAPMSYSPITGSLFCEHCHTEKEIERDYNVRERSFSDMKTYSQWKDSDVTCYRCANCGAKTVLSSTTIATSCPYCGASVVVDNESLGTVKPDTIIPFEVGTRQAEKALNKWRKKRFFAPNSYRKHMDVDLIKGTYLPIWTFDAYTQSGYYGRLGKQRTRTVRRGKQTHTETYIEWFHVSGSFTKNFDDIYVRGNNNVDAKWLAKLQPFSQSKYVIYEDEYLSGFIADNYTVPPEEAFEQAKQKMYEQVRQGIINQYNADVVGDLNIDMQFIAQSFKYLMIPVYITATKYHNKVYNNYVSGVVAGLDSKQNPVVKVSGKCPVSPWKVSAVTVSALILLLALIFLLVPLANDMPIIDFWKMVFTGQNVVGTVNNLQIVDYYAVKTIDNWHAVAL